jgi:hypothetical protein
MAGNVTQDCIRGEGFDNYYTLTMNLCISLSESLTVWKDTETVYKENELRRIMGPGGSEQLHKQMFHNLHSYQILSG